MDLAADLHPSPVYRVRADVTDRGIVEMWLHGKSPHTVEFYARVADSLLAHVQKPLQWLTIEDMQSFADYLDSLGLAKSSQRTYLSAVKSLLSFASKTGLIHFNVGAAVKPPPAKDRLSEKILDEETVRAMIAGETRPRDRLILKIFYYGGLRASELTGLTWRDLNGCFLTVYGKGGKTRTVRLPDALTGELIEWKKTLGASGSDTPIFPSRKGHNPLKRESVTVIVKRAAVRVGADPRTSAHWLRHCHASHSLSKGAPLPLVQQTLGHSNIATTSKYLHVRPDDSSSLYL